ncbi:MAG TPA: GNAT family N-acetyltransferase [Polyangia bacterium]|nr:GNAT family N-acetyltransferase [Polyangia bacterium]
MKNLRLQPLRSGEEGIASDLVMRSYLAATTTDDSAEGVAEFTRYAAADSISRRMGEGSVVVVGFLGTVAVGVVELRKPGHIGLLFISPGHQKSGVGRLLCEAAIEAFARMLPRPPKVTVNSSPGAVAFYEKVGFLIAGALTELKGIRFVPMERELGVTSSTARDRSGPFPKR